MTHQPENEASTRTRLIDVQLARAGWSKNRRAFVEEYSLEAAAPDPAYGKFNLPITSYWALMVNLSPRIRPSC